MKYQLLLPIIFLIVNACALPIKINKDGHKKHMQKHGHKSHKSRSQKINLAFKSESTFKTKLDRIIADFVQKSILEDKKESSYKIMTKKGNGIFSKQFKNKAHIYVVVRRGKINKILSQESKILSAIQDHKNTIHNNKIQGPRLIRLM